MPGGHETSRTKSSLTAYHRTLSNHLASLLQHASKAAGPSCKPHTQANQLATNLSGSSGTSSTSLCKTSSVESPGPSADTAQTSAIVTPPEEPAHTVAWKEAKSDIFRLPPTFHLSLDHRRRSTTSREDGSKEGDRVKGLGIDLAISKEQTMAIRMGLMVEPLVESPLDRTPQKKPLSFDQHRLVPQPSKENMSLQSVATRDGYASNAEDTFRYQQGRSDDRAKSLSSRPRLALKSMKSGSSLRGVGDEEKEEDYELRRELRMKKKQAELNARICGWRQAVVVVSTEMPEIDPTPPTPSIASGMIRLSSPFTFGSSTPVTSFPLAPLPPSCVMPDKDIPDLTERLRAIDALLGDMSLIHPRLNYAAGHVAPLKIIEDDAPRVKHAYGLPTPRAAQRNAFVTTSGTSI